MRAAVRTPQAERRAALQGAAAVELALVLLVLVPLVLGAVEFGRALTAWDTLARTTRAAARHLAVGTPSDPARQLEARCIVVTGTPVTAGAGCAAGPLLPGLTIGQVAILEPDASPAVRAVATGAGTLDLVTVSVQGWRFNALGWAAVPAFSFGPISVTVPYVFF
jgi:Flp pilus assembly protein TadG